jgi:uncharacterized phosphosugar-binding protein
MEYYENITAGDPIVIIGSRIGSMMLTQAVEKALDMKLRVIVITSVEGAETPEWASRIDVLINNHAPGYDRILSCGDKSAAGVGTIRTVTVLNLLTAKTIEKFPDVETWSGSGTVSADEKPMIGKFIERVKHL